MTSLTCLLHNPYMENKSQECVVRVEKPIADRVRLSIECELGVPVSITTAVNKALREYLKELAVDLSTGSRT